MKLKKSNTQKSPCINCKFKYAGDSTCKAFPDGIPERILFGDNQHTKPLPEQSNSITYAPIEK